MNLPGLMFYLASLSFAWSRKRFLLWVYMLGLSGMNSSEANTSIYASDLADTNIPEFIIHAWTTQQGLPGNTVTDFCQTKDGYIWVATTDGLARFDGVKFTSYGVPDGLPHAGITALLEDHHHMLWIGTERGLVINRQKNNLTPQFDRKLANIWITSLTEDELGQIWVGSKWGIYRWSNGEMVRMDQPLGLPPQSFDFLYAEHSGNIWAYGSTSKLFQIKDGKVVAVPKDCPLLKYLPIRSILEDKENRLWVLAGTSSMLFCRENGLWKNIAPSDAAPLQHLHGLTEAVDGTIWLGSHGCGLTYLQGTQFLQISNELSSPTTIIKSLWSDQEGNIWAGMNANGLLCLHPKPLRVLASNSGLTNEAVHSISETADGHVVVGTELGIYFQNARQFDRQNITNDSQTYWSRSVLATPDDNVWWGADAYLLNMQQVSASNLIEKARILLPNNNCVLSLCLDQQTNLWIGMLHGLMRIQGGQLVTGGLYPSNQIQALVLAPDGSMWAGDAKYGIFCLRAGQARRITMSDGLKSDSIRALYFDASGVLWIGTRAGGLSRLKDGQIFSYTTQQGLTSDTISQILEDDSGALWLGSNRGISRVSKKELDDLARGKITSLWPLHLGENDGMPTEECVGSSNPNAFKGKSGLLYFSTLRGIIVINPEQFKKTVPPPSVVIENLLVNNQFWPINPTVAKTSTTNSVNTKSEEFILPPGQDNLEFQYTALHSANPEAIAFRYQLEGLDSTRVAAGSRRFVNYPQIPPGHYRFHVWAANPGGAWTPIGATLRLFLQPYFYQTRWFHVLVLGTSALVLALLVHQAVRRQFRNRLNLLKLEQTLENERRRIASDLHDEVGARLTGITHYGELIIKNATTVEEIKLQVGAINNRVRQLMNAMGEVVWTINPKNDSLTNIVTFLSDYTERFLSLTGTAWRLELDANYPPLPVSAQARHNLLLAAKETLNNAVRHADATMIQLDIHIKNNGLEVMISDNGRGFQISKRRSDSNGLSNIKNRMEAIRGRAEIRSQPGLGTVVTLFMPLNGTQPK